MKSTVEYHAPARYDDVVDVLVRVGRIGRSSMQFLLEIRRSEAEAAETHLVSGELIYVFADAATRRPTPVPGFLREAIGRFERVSPAAA